MGEHNCKILWYSDKRVIEEYKNYQGYCAAVKELSEEFPFYSIIDEGNVCCVDEGED